MNVVPNKPWWESKTIRTFAAVVIAELINDLTMGSFDWKVYAISLLGIALRFVTGQPVGS